MLWSAVKPTEPRAKRPRATADAIVDSACRIAAARGWPAVTIRAVADELGYTSPLLYEHFRNKEELLAAAARRGFGELETRLREIGSVEGDARIVALGVAYLDFAHEKPESYRVMHGLDGASTDPKVVGAGAWAVCDLVSREFTAWARKEEVHGLDPLATTELLWCLVHGIASLCLADRLDVSGTARIEVGVRILLAGLRTTTGRD